MDLLPLGKNMDYIYNIYIYKYIIYMYILLSYMPLVAHNIYVPCVACTYALPPREEKLDEIKGRAQFSPLVSTADGKTGYGSFIVYWCYIFTYIYNIIC